MTDASRPTLHQLDAERDKLRAAFPQWNIWYVPHADGHVAWCAQPLPLLNCGSPEELAKVIEAADR